SLVCILCYAPADRTAWVSCMYRAVHLRLLALDVHIADRRLREPRLPVLADQLFLLEELREVVAPVITRAPLLDDPQAESVRMCFLAHLLAPFLGSRRGGLALRLRGRLRRGLLAPGRGRRFALRLGGPRLDG